MNNNGEVEMEQIIKSDFASIMSLLHAVKPKFKKYNNKYGFILGEDVELYGGRRVCNGIGGFGETAWEAAVDFFRNFFKEGEINAK